MRRTDVELMTIGAFARATGLSPKALRLYGELKLLQPAAVDGETGYRFYHPSQLEPARRIAWLRQLGMPLARIRRIRDLDPAAAAEQVAVYWAQVMANTVARGELAGFLVDYLAGRGTTVGSADTILGIRYAARSEIGLVRTSNEDTAYAGTRLLAVADGMRGPGGRRASAAAVDAFRPLETVTVAAGNLLDTLADTVKAANRAIQRIAETTPSGEAGTTLTVLLWSGSQLGLAHVGDTRAYLLRDGELRRITKDHTYVQSLVDEGLLTAAEAAAHPHRALLVRALSGTGDCRPDLSLHESAAGDRYLLCSDGLTVTVAEQAILDTLTGAGDPAQTVDELTSLAYTAGAPDNLACVVADVVRV